MVLRIGQLAISPADRRAPIVLHECAVPGPASNELTADHKQLSKAEADAELAELYKSCPLAAVIDLQTIATSPEKVDAILPPYHETAAHVPNAPSDDAVPRIRYPVHLGAAADAPEVRVAEVTRVAAKDFDRRRLVDRSQGMARCRQE